MAHEASIILGSGLHSKRDAMREQSAYPNGEVPARGTAVVVLNPEDSSVEGPLRSQQITINSSSGNLIPGNPFPYRRAIAIYNESSTVTVYLGGADVSASNGFPLLPGEKLSIDLSAKAILFGITSSSTASIRILEVR